MHAFVVQTQARSLFCALRGVNCNAIVLGCFLQLGFFSARRFFFYSARRVNIEHKRWDGVSKMRNRRRYGS